MVSTSLSAIEFAFGARDGVRIRMLYRARIEIPSVDGVSVVDEVGGLSTPWSRFQKLLLDPCRHRTGRDVETDQLTAVVADEEEDVQDPVVDSADDQEIGCPDAVRQ
jgi:hypothetical protein